VGAGNFSQAISQVKWLSFVETNISKTISVLVLRVVELITSHHINSTTLRTRTEIVFETLVSTKLNHLTQLIALENFIILTCRESIKLYIAKPGHLKYWHHIQNTVCI